MDFRSVVYPSYYEGQGLIPLEAMASGTPVVTVDHGPYLKWLMIQLENCSLWAIMIQWHQRLLEKLRTLKNFLKGILGRERVLEKYTYESNASRFSEIYSRIV